MHNILFTALLLPAWLSPQTGPDQGPWIEAVAGLISFDGRIDFTALVHTSELLQAGRLILEYDSSRSTFFPRKEEKVGGFLLSVEGNTLDPLPFPFTDVTYWWEVDLQSGTALVSPAQTRLYMDDRFAWRALPRVNLRLFWLEGGESDANDMADLALLSLGSISAELETPIPPLLTVVVYPRLADFHSAMGERVRGWEGAVSSPETATVILAAAPGAEGRAALATLLPHEIAHTLIAARWGSGYLSIPMWLQEGIAAGYEMEPRPEAESALREAADAGSLIPIHALCAIFPSEESGAMLAYAESKSFVAFLKNHYGISAIRNALAAYAGGADCGRGFEGITGRTLDELESDWRTTLSGGASGIPAAWALVLAGFAFLAAVLSVGLVVRRGVWATASGKGRGK
jgi:hypothetical protein